MTVLIVLPFLFFSIFADDNFSYFTKKGVKKVEEKLYINACGSCHFAYQPGLLPEQSWTKLMSNLENHFDTDASLLEEDLNYLTNYLTKHSANRNMNYKRSRKIVKSIKDSNYPIAITKIPYFEKEHRKIPKKLILQEEVKGLFNCIACHTKAKEGLYDDDTISIPNYGKWDD